MIVIILIMLLGLYIGAAYNSITIEQNWIEPVAGYADHGRGILFYSYCVNSIIRNNIIKCDTNEIAIVWRQKTRQVH